MNNKGFNLIELLVSTCILSVVLLGIVNVAVTNFSFSTKHTDTLEKIKKERYISERITDEIRRASYIAPANQNITLMGTTSTTFSTNNGIVLLIPVGSVDDSNLMYTVEAFYIASISSGTQSIDNLYEFTSRYPITWNTNSSPLPQISSAYGESSLIMSDVNKSASTITYSLAGKNSLTDDLLIGVGVPTTSSNALIGAIDWNIAINDTGEDYSINVKGIANNVPRYIP